MTDFLYAPSLPVLASPPATPGNGMAYVRQSDYQVLVYNATTLTWVAQGTGGGGGGGFAESVLAEISADTSTTSTTFVDLLTATITTAAGFLLIDFTVSATGSNATQNTRVEFQVLVNGTPIRGTAVTVTSNSPQSGALSHRIAVAAGTHTIKVQWRVSQNTGRIRPVSTITEHASLRVCEVGA